MQCATLHVPAMQKEPTTEGAQYFGVSSYQGNSPENNSLADKRNALQIAKRLTKAVDYLKARVDMRGWIHNQ